MTKQFDIIDCVSNEKVSIIPAANGKIALNHFRANNCLSTGIYEIYKNHFGTWIMSSDFGSYFIAKETK